MVHISGVLGSISGPHCWVNMWSPSFRYIKIVVSEDFCEPSSQRGAKLSPLSGVLVQNRFFKKGVAKIAFFIFCYGGCWWMLLLNYKKGVAKKL